MFQKARLLLPSAQHSVLVSTNSAIRGNQKMYTTTPMNKVGYCSKCYEQLTREVDEKEFPIVDHLAKMVSSTPSTGRGVFYTICRKCSVPIKFTS